MDIQRATSFLTRNGRLLDRRRLELLVGDGGCPGAALDLAPVPAPPLGPGSPTA